MINLKSLFTLSKHKHIFFLIIIVLVIVGILFLIKKESFLVLYPYGPDDYLFNFPTREFYHTRNMSYDIRGDPFPIPLTYIGPFNQPTIPPKNFYPIEYIPGAYGYPLSYIYPPMYAAPYSTPFAENFFNLKSKDLKKSKTK